MKSMLNQNQKSDQKENKCKAKTKAFRNVVVFRIKEQNVYENIYFSVTISIKHIDVCCIFIDSLRCSRTHNY